MQSIKDDAFTVCPECDIEALHRIIHAPLHIQIKGEATTIGQLAERNAKSISKEEMDKVQANFKTQKTINRIPEHLRPKTRESEPLKDSPEWINKPRTKTTGQIKQMNPEQTKRYVETGQ